MTQMYEHNFWLSFNDGHNFSTSVIHFDMNHQIMCLFGGTKEWIMWDLQTEGKHIPMWSGHYDPNGHRATGSDDSPIDGERVDLQRWPAFKDAKWVNTTMQAGDCLYTPALLLHYVRSWGRNVAAMSMFQQEERYDASCGGEVPGEPQLLSAYDVLWSFPEEDASLLGWNVVKMGFPNWKRRMLWPMAEHARHVGGSLTRMDFLKMVLMHAKRAGGPPGVKSRAEKVFKAMDADGDGKVEPEKLFRSRDLRFILKDIAVFEEDGRGDQEEDVEVDRYDLHGTAKSRRLDL